MDNMDYRYKVKVDWNGSVITLMKTQRELSDLLTQDGVTLISVNEETRPYKHRPVKRKAGRVY